MVIHLTKSLKYLVFEVSEIFELEKDLEQTLHLNLVLLFLSLPHLIVFLEPQNLQER